MALTQDTPASRPRDGSERKRIPMSVAVSKLDCPKIPGYHLHWFNGTPDRIARALDGGYEYVDQDEVRLNATGLGSDTVESGNTDLGSRVSIVAGTELGTDGQAIRLVLMKIKQEWYEEDQKLVEERNDLVAHSLTGGMAGAQNASDKGELNMRYVGSRTKLPELFTKGAMARRRPA